MTKFYYTPTDDSLIHHGIKGQKHGVRRYQNQNGTWTEEGKARRRIGDGHSGSYEGVKKAQAKYDKAAKDFDDYKKKNNLFQPDDDGPVYANEDDFKKGKIHKKGTELSDKADAAYKELEDIEYGRNNATNSSSNEPTFKNDIQRRAYENAQTDLNRLATAYTDPRNMNNSDQIRQEAQKRINTLLQFESPELSKKYGKALTATSLGCGAAMGLGWMACAALPPLSASMPLINSIIGSSVTGGLAAYTISKIPSVRTTFDTYNSLSDDKFNEAVNRMQR